MNLKVKSYPIIKRFLIIVVCFSLALGVFLVLLKWSGELDEKQDVAPEITEDTEGRALPTKKETYQELSPDGSRKISRYLIKNNPDLFANNYVTYFDNNIIISITKNIGDIEREYYIFVGEERTGDPHWLGNNYVFFTSHCGSSCQGLTLLNVETGQRWLAVLAYSSYNNAQKTTYFHDWFKKDFEFNGFVQKIHATLEKNQPYLILDILNDNGIEAGEKRFLFTGTSLKAAN